MKTHNKYSRAIATFFLLIFFPTLVPTSLFASNNGPKAPEAANFEPVDATDMVNLATGDMSYVLPLLNVPSPGGGYPISLTYHGGIAYESEASWVGLGWNLNPGSIDRGVNGVPDDWKESMIRDRSYYNFNSTQVSVGVSVGLQENASIDMGVTYGWDSNDGRYGVVNLGGSIKVGEVNASNGISMGYGNKVGAIYNYSIGASIHGASLGVSIGTSGAAIGANYSLALGKIGKSPLNASMGISLSSNSSGASFSAGIEQSNFSSNTSSLGELTETNMGVSIPLVVVPAWIRLGLKKVKYVNNETNINYVNGPLYYNEFNYSQRGIGSNYSTEMGAEINRNLSMDIYEQKAPSYEAEITSYQDSFDQQNHSFTFPAYDTYVVNAQGLSGSMTPRLLENGTLIGASENIELQNTEPYFGGFVTGSNGVIPSYTIPPVPGWPYNYYGISPKSYFKFQKESYVKNWNYNMQSRKFENQFGTSNNPNQQNQIQFYFENSFPSNLSVTPSNIIRDFYGTDIVSHVGTQNNKIGNGNRQQNANYVETFTNKQMLTNQTVLEAVDGDEKYNRAQDPGYSDEGIGGYRITTPDGKTYHYSMPVYQFEEFHRQLKKDGNDFFPEDRFYQEKRKINPYATHWVLTAITGPDYVKTDNSRKYPGQGDYGYWVRFDYGKWTDGYTWRTPYKNYNDFDQNANYAGVENGRQYSWGRKQLTYLNKVVTQTHTALFVKSLRNDSKSREIGCGGDNNFFSFEGDVNINYPMQRTLKLDEIILVKNEFVDVSCSSQNTNLIGFPNSTISLNWISPITKNYNPYDLSTNNISYKINKQHKILDSNDFLLDANGKYKIYENALKIIKLNQDYSLATGSPHSDAPAVSGVYASGGRLTLKSIKTYGRNYFDYMPPTVFEYAGNNDPYINCNNAICGNEIKDPWGYNKNAPKTWSLQKIINPTGSSIEIELEKDTYWTEAFSRRYWKEDLSFTPTIVGNNTYVLVQNKLGSNAPTNFLDYFMPNERVFLDLWICRKYKSTFQNEEAAAFNTIGDQYSNVVSVTANGVLIQTQGAISGGNNNLLNGVTFSRGPVAAQGSNLYYSEKRGDCPDVDGIAGFGQKDHHSMYFCILANRIPGEGTGGGLRVKSLSSVDELNYRYTTDYNYSDPIKARTSGITSFAPVRGLKYIAYQSEVPAPRVMYEYVTVKEKQSNNGQTTYNGKTIYKFDVLENANDIFDKNLTSGDNFRANVSIDDFNNPLKKVRSSSIHLEDNTSQLGSVISVTKYNNQNQLLSKIFNKRKSLNELKEGVQNNTVKGSVKESFQSMKSIYQFNEFIAKAEIGFDVILANYTVTKFHNYGSELITKNRFLNVSSKTLYKPYLDYTEEIDPTGKSQKTYFEDPDPLTGQFNSQITTKNNIKNTVVPAYTKYPEMGSKVLNINNKNMLSQEAISITSKKINNVWKTINANVTTWNDSWAYRNDIEETNLIDNTNKVWRKHKTFSWKEPVNSIGAYTTALSVNNILFDWGLGKPLSDKWQKLSEITRYNHFSIPIETKDINGNFAASKMADKNSKVIVSGNARYSEMYFAGAENVASGNVFDGDVKGANFRTTAIAHTGKYSVVGTNIGDKVFEVNGSSGSSNYYNDTEASYDQTFRPGKYKVSFWTLDGNSIQCRQLESNSYGGDLILNNVVQTPTETVKAGCWTQLNYIIDIPANVANNSIYVKYKGSACSESYFDDFRMHPIASSINSYVYDDKTDELSYTLDANNMGSAYKYDLAGRLIANYVEDVDFGSNKGGFKLISQFKQNFINSSTLNNKMPLKLDNCKITYGNSLSANITNICTGTFSNKFNVSVSGGSGNYSYEYKWKTNLSLNTFTNYVSGLSTFNIPYVPNFCYDIAFGKKWDFVVKIKDNVTNVTIEKAYVSELNCENKKYFKYDFDLEISDCYGFCQSPNKTFRIHLKDIGDFGNLKYEYAYYNPSTPIANQTLNWVNVTSNDGKFCPVFSLFPDTTCKTGYRDVLYLAIRVKNNNSPVGTYPGGLKIYTYFGSCSQNSPVVAPLANTYNLNDSKFMQEGLLLEKDIKGVIVSSNLIKN
jgi:hypothetical protein